MNRVHEIARENVTLADGDRLRLLIVSRVRGKQNVCRGIERGSLVAVEVIRDVQVVGWVDSVIDASV